MKQESFQHTYQISSKKRAYLKSQEPFILWLTGLSGAGKSTLANALEEELHAMKKHTYVLDGDNLRMGLNSDLGYSKEARCENIRRAAEVAKLMLDAGLIVICAFISPFEKERQQIKQSIPSKKFIEIFVDTPMGVCESRDVKGLYKKARNGDIKQFTGIDSIYEPPKNPDIHLHTENQSVQEMTHSIMHYLRINAYL